MHIRLKLTRTTTKPSILVMHMSYAMSQLLIHRPYLHSEFRSTAVARSAMHTVNAAATTITRLLGMYFRCSDMAGAPFFVTHHILSAGTVHLLNSTSNDRVLRRRSVARLKICFDALERMSKNRFDRASHAISSLRELAARWNATSALPIKHAAPITPDSGWNQTESHMNRTESAGLAAPGDDYLYTDFDDVLNSGFLDLWQQSVPDERFALQHDVLNLGDSIDLELLWACEIASPVESSSEVDLGPG